MNRRTFLMASAAVAVGAKPDFSKRIVRGVFIQNNHRLEFVPSYVLYDRALSSAEVSQLHDALEAMV